MPSISPSGSEGMARAHVPSIVETIYPGILRPVGTPTDPSRPWLRPLSDLMRCPLCGEMAWSCFRLEPNLLSVLETSRPQGSLTLFIHSFIKCYKAASCRAMKTQPLSSQGSQTCGERDTQAHSDTGCCWPLLLCESKYLLPSYAVTS